MRSIFGLLFLWQFYSLWLFAGEREGKFERLGTPVGVGLMGCVVGPDGRGGDALYFNLNQTNGKLFLVP